MADLPKSVVRRLDQPASEHPDANVLAAFSEQALTSSERQQVIAHLARCAACRQVIELALPQEEAQQPVTVPAPWYRRPSAYAWAGALATVVVGAALLVNYGDMRVANKSAYSSDEKLPSIPAASARDQVATPPVQAPAKPAGEAKMAEIPKAKADRMAAAATKPARDAALGQKQEMQRIEEQRATAATIAGGAVPGQIPAPPRKPDSAAPAAAPAAELMAKKQSVHSEEPDKDTLDRPKTAANAARPDNGVVVAEAAGALSQGRNVQSKLAYSAAPPRWTIAADGQLQRSFDGGQSWQRVIVEKDASFRAVAVVGNDVWAGGAALYHSSDAGTHWTRQSLGDSQAVVTSLSFADALHGTARTADGSAWSTSDGGQHWAPAR